MAVLGTEIYNRDALVDLSAGAGRLGLGPLAISRYADTSRSSLAASLRPIGNLDVVVAGLLSAKATATDTGAGGYSIVTFGLYFDSNYTQEEVNVLYIVRP